MNSDLTPTILLADGGALADFNDRLKAEGRPTKDFVKVPDAALLLLTQEGRQLDCPKTSRIFCNVGFEKAISFHDALAEAWTVRTFPLTLARYERAADTIGGKHPFRLRFHAYLGYVLGLVTQADYEVSPLIGVLTDDPHLLPCMADSRSRGCEVRLMWWESAISEEVAFQAARQEVKITYLLTGDSQATRTRDDALQSLIPPRRRTPNKQPQRSRKP